MHFISISIAYCSCRLIAAVLANKLFSTGLFMLLVLLGQNAYSKAKTTKKRQHVSLQIKLKTDSMY